MALVEKEPEILGGLSGKSDESIQADSDAIAALSALGYDSPTIMQVLQGLPDDLGTTEERVAAALRAL